MTRRTRVVLVDDQNMVRRGFRMMLDSEEGIEIVGEAADGAQAVALVARLRPDVVAMDIQMPVLDGLAATRLIVANDSTARILVLTTFDQDDLLFEALSSGASGFVLKNAPPEALIEAIHVLARGDALLSPEVTRRVIERFARNDVSVAPPRGVDGLTDRERDVVAAVAQGLTNIEVAASLNVGEATVKTHLSHVLTKLALRDRTRLVIWAYESGLIAPGANASILARPHRGSSQL
jgi:DNA-binding NarL/FixJ family response regulator